MKKVIFAVMLMIGMSIMVCSCQKDNENGGGGSGSGSGSSISTKWLAGSWVLSGEDQIYWYWELTANGHFKYYDLNGDWLHSYTEDAYATFSNGTLTTPAQCTWKVSLEGKYTLEGDEIYVDDVVFAKIEKLGKDKALMTSTILEDGIVERIKSFKTK